MSVICRTFVQNAWRSDLCSNCFKSLEDHSDRRNNVCEKIIAGPRYVPQAASLYQSRGISTSLKWRGLTESLYERVSRRDIASQTPQSKMNGQQKTEGSRGILIKGGDSSASAEKKFKSRSSVDFASEEALVIGYGGNDYDSDTSPWEMGSDDGSIDLDLLDDTDEDRKITRLTKNNTEFNSFNKNLLSSSPGNGKVKKEEDKQNTINNNNNNVNNAVKTTDKSISILTYNDIQSTRKTEKKLNQYFFPSSTDIKSYLNGHGNSLVVEEPVQKNNNQKSSQVTKVQNCKREVENVNSSKVTTLNDDFTPLNTRTYSFVSELNKSNVSFEQSSDSDYSTCRHTTTGGDSTDSESFHEAEESRRPLPKSSFLHGTYAMSSPQINDSDIDKKYDAGSSTSGDVSNLSDDSDTHDAIADRTTYKTRSARIPLTLSENQNSSPKREERNVQFYKKVDETFLKDQQKEERREQVQKKDEDLHQKIAKESPKTDGKQQYLSKSNQKSKQSPPCAKLINSSTLPLDRDRHYKSHAENNQKDVSRKSLSSVSTKDVSHNASKNSETLNLVLKSTSMPNIPPHQEAGEVKRSPISKTKENKIESERAVIAKTSKESSPKSSPSCLRPTNTEMESKQLCHSTRIPENSLIENETNSKEVILRDKELREYEDHSDSDKSPDAIIDRQSKLAALALELELARRDSEAKANKAASSSACVPAAPPEVKVRYSAPCTPSINSNSPSENYPTIKKTSAIPCTSRLSTLPDVLQETPAKQKKTKFSLKKLLKRNKDSGTFSPANKEVNQKAWKKQTFDRNRLSLEIVHPMDLTSDVPNSADSTPTEEHKQIVSNHPGKFMFKTSSRARSLSALPQLSGDDQSGCALLECRKMDTVPARKAGTVAERKKNRPALVRTPSCSALPNRSATDRTPPPKPPPPPSKCKAAHPPPPPPPPHSHPRAAKTHTCSPARPPPPKVPDPMSRSHSSGSSAQELHEQNHSDKEYANLGDIRSLLTPKKPQRPSAFSATPREGVEMGKGASEDIYETLPPQQEEEDHYTYLDEAEVRMSKDVRLKCTSKTSKAIVEAVSCGRPWLDLQTSYAAIAAANYESLAELITTSLNESADYFKKVEPTLRWRDFVLESSDQCQMVREKAIYNALYKNESQDKVTLVVSPRRQTTPQNARNPTRYPVLACFSDPVPKNFIGADNYVLQESEMPASIYVLQPSKVTTVANFAKSSSSDLTNQSVHLRDYCFVLLQLVHTLKSLQAEGIEEIHQEILQILVLVSTEERQEDKPPMLVLFPEDKLDLTSCDASNKRTLCQATLEAMLHFLQVGSTEDLKTSCVVNGEQLAEPVAHTFRVIAKVLAEEKASSLSQAKGFLEYMLWGPVDVMVSQADSDTVLQRWLDLQRAQMVKSTISHLQSKKNFAFHVYEEYQLIFLLQASVKSLKNVISKL